MSVLTKTKIIKKIKVGLNCSKSLASDIMEDLLKIIKEPLGRGEDLKISGFGKFCIKKKKERLGRNPATNKPMVLSARKVIIFKCSGKLKKNINNK